ncbi:serine/arginine-rich splicing factor RS31-like isoform X2 [Salvia hispanica]|uniref:serine/arginine-rich splicing factor RS31-like isoform X2 n=1 Tax=Salvia hispanica TaxID=49212 RepID=UPI0020091C93|nr:serine/arginine-rich splicing factor RS31-like isoform X2 [Salvia hispanica]
MVEWATDECCRHHDGSESKTRPNKTLFVIHFDLTRTRDHDIKSHFERYGRVLNVSMRQNYAFVQFETQENATEALKRTHGSKIFDRIISVGYAFRRADEKGSREGSPPRGENGRRRNDASLRSSIPACRHGRTGPDYGLVQGTDYDRRCDGPSKPSRAQASHVYDRYKGPSNPRARILDRVRARPVYDRYNGPSNQRARRTDRGRASRVYDRYGDPSNPRAKSPARDMKVTRAKPATMIRK